LGSDSLLMNSGRRLALVLQKESAPWFIRFAPPHSCLEALSLMRQLLLATRSYSLSARGICPALVQAAEQDQSGYTVVIIDASRICPSRESLCDWLSPRAGSTVTQCYVDEGSLPSASSQTSWRHGRAVPRGLIILSIISGLPWVGGRRRVSLAG
jgi:hypothetical protein